MKEKNISGLIIEDDPEDTMLLMDLLAHSDWPAFKFAFICAEDLRTGLRLLAENDIEVVLLDLMLPDSQGIETVVKTRAQAPDVPIVVMTGVDDEKLGLAALANGAQDYQVKGEVSGHALKRTISYAVERHRLLASLKNIITSAPDGMVVVDSEEVVQYVNPAAEAFFCRKERELLGRPFPYPLPKGSGGELRIGAEGEGGAERVAELRISEIEWRGRPARLAAIRDMTQQRRVEQLTAEVIEGRRRDKLKDEMINTVSHEIRSPLTIIKAAAINLKEGVAGPLSDQQANMVLLQNRNISRLEKLIDNILDFARLESGQAKISPQRVNAVKLIRETLGGFRLVAGKRGLLIQQAVPHDLPFVWADPELLSQVLGNLIDNAMRFARGRIVVRAAVAEAAQRQDERGYVQFSVIDDGPGVASDRVGDLFKKFVQLARGGKGEGYKGTGLGLAICREIVERQQGRIWAESKEGETMEFHFLLPQASRHEKD